MDTVISTLQRKYEGVTFRVLDVDSSSWAVQTLRLTHVPAFILCGGGRVVERITGAQAALLTRRVTWLSTAPSDALLDAAVVAAQCMAPVTLFMKGSPDTPRCGFSRQIVALLKSNTVAFEHLDILRDQEIRQRTKVIADWPTYPQLYAHGQLLGGLDIVREMAADGTLAEEIAKAKNDAGDTGTDSDAVPVPPAK